MIAPLKRTKPGSKVEKDAVSWAKERGWKCIKIAKTDIRGYPDRLFIYQGRYVWVEFKGPREALSPAQERRIAELSGQGCMVFVCRELLTFTRQMNRVMLFGETENDL